MAVFLPGFDVRDDNYQTILAVNGTFAYDTPGATWLFTGGSYGAGNSATLVVQSGSTNALSGGQTVPLFYFDDADYATSSKTQKLRVRAQVAANATAPAITFTVGLYPLTVAGGADGLVFTAGTVVSGSTVAHASPNASTVTQSNSGDFTIPSDGAYGFAVVASGTIANNSATQISAQLQTRWV